jgi:hypothetical protein
MSSAISTNAAEQVGLKGAPAARGGQPEPAGGRVRPQPDQGLQPWQFFVLAALTSATAVTFIVRGQGPTVVILLSVLMGVTALAGLAALRMFLPLVGAYDDRPLALGERTRATLEREKMLSLRTIKELEFDRAMGKVSDEDFREMSGRLRARAARLMKQLDAGAGYREQIERDLAKRLGDKGAPAAAGEAARACAKCSTVNDTDARFCKSCGDKL